MESSTKILRRLLDERGVEYRTDGHMQTWWEFGADGRAFAVSDGRAVCLAVTGAAPEQAVAATLGPGTCHAVFEVDAMSGDERIGEFVCSECGETFNDGHGEFPHYCPGCGRKVVC